MVSLSWRQRLCEFRFRLFEGSKSANGDAGRRVAKTVGGTKTSFLRAGSAEIAEYDSSGTLLRRYIPGSAPDSFIAWVEGTGTTSSSIKWIAADRQGSTAAVTDNSGKVTQRFAYDPYGNEVAGAPGTGFPFRYTGQRFDPETGLYYYKARYYSAKLGRFLQTDPIGYKDQLNLYAYVGNDPNDATDPSGTDVLYVGIALTAVVGGGTDQGGGLALDIDALRHGVKSIKRVGFYGFGLGESVGFSGVVTYFTGSVKEFFGAFVTGTVNLPLGPSIGIGYPPEHVGDPNETAISIGLGVAAGLGYIAGTESGDFGDVTDADGLKTGYTQWRVRGQSENSVP